MSELPPTWTSTTLGLVSQITTGNTPSTKISNYFGGSHPFVKPGDLDRRLPIVETVQTLSDAGAANARLVRPGAVLVSCIGNLGKIGIAGKPLATNQQINAVEFHASMIDDRYGYYYCCTLKTWMEQSSSATTVTILNKRRFSLAPIDVAPLAEQRRIANQLDTLLTRVQACNDRFDAIPALVKRFRQTVLDAATFGALTESWRESNGGDYEWKEVQLRDIADVQGGVTKDSKKQSVLDEEVPYLRVANVQRGYIDLSEVKTIRVPATKLEGLLLADGDILFNEGGDLDKLGRGWIWEGQITRCTFQNHVFRARLFDKGNQPKFVSWWGNSRGLEYFLRSGKQTTNLASINKTMLAALPMRLPSVAEQAEIVRRVEALFALADRIDARCTAARTQAQRLSPLVLAKAFRGELVQQDPNDEPASALLARIASANTAGAGKNKQKVPLVLMERA